MILSVCAQGFNDLLKGTRYIWNIIIAGLNDSPSTTQLEAGFMSLIWLVHGPATFSSFTDWIWLPYVGQPS